MSKFRLTLEEGYDFLVVGISCHLKDFRVAWHINREFRMSFVRSTFTTQSKHGEILDFALFQHKDTDNHLRYILLSNHNDEQYFLPQLKQYDFFLFVEGYIDIFSLEEFTEKLRKIEAIQFLSVLENDPFKKVQYTLFEE